MMEVVDLTLCGCCKKKFTNAAGANVPLSMPCGDTCCSSCVELIADCHECRMPVVRGPHPQNRLMLQMILQKERDLLDGIDTTELLAMFQEKKKRENATKLAELAVQQTAAQSVVDELRSSLKEAEAEGSRVRSELRTKERLLAEMDEQARFMGGAVATVSKPAAKRGRPRKIVIDDGSSSSKPPAAKRGRPRKEEVDEEGAIVERIKKARADIVSAEDPGEQLNAALSTAKTRLFLKLIQAHRQRGTLDEVLEWECPQHMTFHLQAACIHDNEVAVRALLEAGCDVNRVNRIYGSTALMAATTKGKTQCVRTLLACPGIQVNLVDRSGQSALDRSNNEDIRNLLIEAGAVQGSKH